MGCKCSPSSEEKACEEIIDIYEDDNNNPETKLEISEYSKTLFKLINKIRTNPKKFADLIDKLKVYITTTEKGEIIFDYRLKILLTKGKEIFDEVVNQLKNMDPIEPLIFKDEIVVDVPDNENDIKDISIFINKIKEKKKSIQIDDCFKDAIKDPEISFFMIVIDDTPKNGGKKRNAILNKNYKYIGISSVKLGKSFCAYFTFSQ